MRMDLNLKQIVYSNSEYFDVLDVFLEQNSKYGIDHKNYLIFSDKIYSNSHSHILYNNNLSYSERLLSCLNKINETQILYQHEDMFLYDYPNIGKLKEYCQILQHRDYSFIRLSLTGNCNLTKSNISKTLYEIKKDSIDFFAVQPTIWKKEDFINFLSKSRSKSIWDLEINGNAIAKEANLRGLIHFDHESKRGGHYNSSVWPYVATAIVKKKWNFVEYSKELSEIEKISNSKRVKLF